MEVKLSEFDNLVRGYTISELNKYFPNLDLTRNSAYDDLFIRPISALVRPLFEKLSKSELMDLLSNAEFMDEETLDELAESNYVTPRREGNKALATITLSFTDIYEDEAVTIPAATIFNVFPSDLHFQTLEQRLVTYAELLANYNESTMTYDIDIIVEAVEVGTKYNVEPGQINQCLSFFSAKLQGVTNKRPAEGGINKEGNVEYAERIRDFFISRQLGTDPGYRSVIIENFTEVEDVYVAGKNDKYMQRDKILVKDPETDEDVYKHIGGMVDIYIKGTRIMNVSEEFKVNTGNLVLSKPAEQIDQDSIKIVNNADDTKKPVVKEISIKTYSELYGVPSLEDVEPKFVFVEIDNTDEQSFAKEVISQLYVSYSYTLDGITSTQIDVFPVGLTEIALESPVVSVSTVRNPLKDEVIGKELYEVRLKGDVGTTSEDARVVLVNDSTFINGQKLSVTYSLNTTLSNVGALITGEKYRIITTDIMIKEASPVPVNVSLRVKMKRGQRLNADRIKAIERAIRQEIDNKLLGGTVSEFDIVTAITVDPAINEYVDYVSIPFVSLYIPDDIEDEMEEKRETTMLEAKPIEYLSLNKAEIREYVE